MTSLFFVRAWQELREKRITMNLVSTLGLGSALLWSIVAFLGQRQTYFSSVLLSGGIFVLVQYLERHSVNMSKSRIDRSLERISYYFPLVLALAGSIALVFGGLVFTSPTEALRRVVVLFLIATPCALGQEPGSLFASARLWAFFYATVGGIFAILGFATPAVVNFFLIASSLTVFVSGFLRRPSL